MTIAAQLEVALGLQFSGRTDDALDVIYDVFDDTMLDGGFQQLDAAIKAIDVLRFSTDLLLGILTITRAAKSKLASRAEFFECARQVIQDRGELTPRLLIGLE